MSLFRPEAERYQRDSWLGDIALVAPGKIAFLAALFVGLLISFFVWASVTSFPRTVEARGVISPVGGLIEVKAARSGRVLAIEVKSGERVASNDVLLRLGSGVEPYQGVSVSELRRRLDREYLQTESAVVGIGQVHSRARETLSSQLKAARERVLLLRDQGPLLDERITNAATLLASYRSVGEKGIIPRLDVLRQESAVIELKRARLVLAAEIADAKRVVSELEERIARAEVALVKDRLYYERQLNDISSEVRSLVGTNDEAIHAPFTGQVRKIGVEVGEYVSSERTLVWLQRERVPLEAIVHVDEETYRALHLGSNVEIKFDAYPARRYGMLSGAVKEIASIPTTVTTGDRTSAKASGQRYKITVEIPQSFSSPGYEALKLNAGMQIAVVFSLESKRIIHWLVPALERALPRA